MAAQITNLPSNILSLIFEQLDQTSLSNFLQITNSSLDNTLRLAAQTVKYSSIIVSNQWQNLIKLLPRALQLIPVHSLDYYHHVSLDEFNILVHKLDRLWDSRFPVRRKIYLVVRCDVSNQSTKYKTIRDLHYVLLEMPLHVHSAIRLVKLCLPDLNEMVPDQLSNEALTLLFRKFVEDPILHESLDSLGLHGRTSAFLASIPNNPISDFSLFRNLTSLQLNDLNLESIRGFQFPNSLLKLNLARNRLRNLKCEVFPPHLELLNLSDNKLERLKGGKLPRKLKKLTISKNLLQEICDLPPFIEELDISFNDLAITALEQTLPLNTLCMDMAQFYLMPKNIKEYLASRHILVKNYAIRGKGFV